jgi:hypothetical protein
MANRPPDVGSRQYPCLELQPVLAYELVPLKNPGNAYVRAQAGEKEAVIVAETLLLLFTKRRPEGLGFPQTVL